MKIQAYARRACRPVPLVALALLPAAASAQEQPAATAAQEPMLLQAEGVMTALYDSFGSWLASHLGSWCEIPVMGVQAWRYLALAVLLFLTLLTAKLAELFVRRGATRIARHTAWQGDDMLVQAADRPAVWFVMSLGMYVAISPILVGFPAAFRIFIGHLCVAGAAVTVLWYLYRAVGVLDHYLRRLASRTDNDLDNSIVDVIRKSLRVALIIIGTLFIGQTILKLKITALLAGAGVAGVAIAFAAQDTIGNLFGTVMILLDKPFRVGDRVLIKGADGPVESIGFRSTRIRTLDGHLVSIPNREVASEKIQNIGKRPHIKRVSNITITYDTPPDKVERALAICREIFADHEGMDPEFPPRVFFNDFASTALNILAIAWYHPPEYWDYLQWCERTNLALLRAFNDEGIEFAFPTTTTYLAHDPNRPLTIVTGGPQPQTGDDHES